ncbi:RNA polymerase sigma-70 factor (sigma-E family) [Barrientosiimonas humi]|uniref:RNA polymerase sigma-70 factor (Sigma-E family) n=1 Tax=Barrientosiimonas humi TaxID=999931 RepID=A0A542WZL3_9MICO|nr:SigE family RNA polymerase sigma factor [Barrientosiimonas humi]TQL28982.1 RNA polymerase sigma-70 factor (sigma-E family) [Barrientosiimonas humi]CAG7571424.1 ECF RNA polymerase sigma factor SigM [Barrientosiimonas humi]
MTTLASAATPAVTRTVRARGTGVTFVPAEVDLADLYAAHHLSMVRLARLLVDDLATAEDVVQDAFLGLHRNQATLRDPGAAVGYIRQAVVNQARSTLRRRRTARAHLRVAEPDVAPPADAGLLLSEEHQQVLQAVRRLPERQREVLVLRFWSGLSEAEIAQAMGVSRGTVKSQASRAMKTLQTYLEEARS